jgi:hypothetical protein
MLQPIVPGGGNRAGGLPMRRGAGLHLMPMPALASSSRAHAWTAY